MGLLSIFWGLLIGTILGLLGGGGALISIPILLYIFHLPFTAAVGTSLLLVSLGALPSVLLYWKNQHIDWRSAFWMGTSGSVGAWIGSALSHHVPQHRLVNVLILLILLSVWRLLKPATAPLSQVPPPQVPPAPLNNNHTLYLIMAGTGIGILTGLVGVGGGFLIVPALIMLQKMSSRNAIATSLVVISLNAISGTIGHWKQIPFDQHDLYSLIIATILGSLLGFKLNQALSQTRLKQGFSILLLFIATLLFLKPPMH